MKRRGRDRRPGSSGHPTRKGGGARGRSSCLILLGGEIAAYASVRAAARGREIICADGALRHARNLNIFPDFVVGDMDSLPHVIPTRRGMVFWCDFDSNRSDFQKCLDFARRRGFARAYVAGALGGRLDHAAVNLALAERARARPDVILLDRGEGRILNPGVHRPRLGRGEIFSLLPLSRCLVDLSGCAYPLRKTVLERGSRGLSNKAGPSHVVLTIRRGRLWFFSNFK